MMSDKDAQTFNFRFLDPCHLTNPLFGIVPTRVPSFRGQGNYIFSSSMTSHFQVLPDSSSQRKSKSQRVKGKKEKKFWGCKSCAIHSPLLRVVMQLFFVCSLSFNCDWNLHRSCKLVFLFESVLSGSGQWMVDFPCSTVFYSTLSEACVLQELVLLLVQILPPLLSGYILFSGGSCQEIILHPSKYLKCFNPNNEFQEFLKCSFSVIVT